MKVTLKKLPQSVVQLHVTVDASEMVAYFAQAYERLAPSVAIKGFRPGNAPKSMVLERIGIDRYTQEAINQAIIDTYYQSVHREKVVPLTQPAVNIHEFGAESSLVYDATVDVLPEIDLGNYQKLSVKLPTESVNATEEEIEIVLRRLKFQAATFADVDRAAKQGDRVEISFTGKVRGVVQDDLTSQHYPILIGDTPLIPGFEAKLVGITKGKTTTFTLKLDKRSVDFSVDCEAVQSVTLPELNDEFAKNFGHDDVASLTAALKSGIENEKREQHRHKQEEVILEALQKTVKLELPQSLIEQEIDRRIESIKQQLGVTFDKFIADRHEGKIESLRASLSNECKRSVSAGLILGEIAQKEQLVPAGGAKTPEEQRDVMRSTIDKLIEFAAKNK